MIKEIIKIKLSTNLPNFIFNRLSPGEKNVWGNCHFFINQDNIKECDFWIIYDCLPKIEKAKCPPGNTILITGEPPSVKTYSNRYIKQFGYIITSHEKLKHQKKIIKQQALPWMIGNNYFKKNKSWDEKNYKNYDFFKKTERPLKTKTISVILSNKKGTSGHKKRTEFVKLLKSELGDHLDIFGIGFNEIRDKWDGIAPYKYHLAIENSVYPHYWTEKLSDAFLGFSFPIYYGCPNIKDYFTEDSLARIDIKNPEDSIKKIKEIISSDIYEKSTDAIERSRDWILNKYNFFPYLADFINDHKNDDKKIYIKLKPEKVQFLNKVKNIIRKKLIC